MTPTILLWVVFNLFVLGMLALDLGVFHRRAHTVGLRSRSLRHQWGCTSFPPG